MPDFRHLNYTTIGLIIRNCMGFVILLHSILIISLTTTHIGKRPDYFMTNYGMAKLKLSILKAFLVAIYIKVVFLNH